ncbi:MAG: ABC transporter permease subunit [Pseudomonadales bacterium]
MSSESRITSPDIDFNTPAILRKRKLRAFKDKFATCFIAVGGMSVIVAILLIFFYLLYEIVPLFQPASVERWQQDEQVIEAYSSPGEGRTLYLGVEEQVEIGLRVTDAKQAVFFDVRTGKVVSQEALPVPAGASITSFALISESLRLFALGYDNGQVSIIKHEYQSTYPEGKRVITPSLSFPLGEEPLDAAEGAVDLLAASNDEENWSIVAGADQQLTLTQISAEENLLTEEVEITSESRPLPDVNFHATKLLLLPGDKWLMAAGSKGKMALYDLKGEAGAELAQVLDASDSTITSFQLLLGSNALIIGDDKGQLSQWFLVRDDSNNWQLQKIREFEAVDGAVTSMAMEHRRKGFAVLSDKGQLSLYNTTANRNVLREAILSASVDAIAYSPRSNALLFEQNGELVLWAVDNEHPDVSWSALWQEVWYEGYQEPDYIWQSSASNNDFEPKYSLMPLAFGTLKAAFYAMLLATPLAICGAIYTAYFMAPAMRKKVKPMIELMEALPTVILGFLAGLWLAPFIENNLAGIFLCLLTIPVAILGFGFGWANLPKRIRHMVPDGWDAALLLPVVVLAGVIGVGLSGAVEGLLFDGNLRQWITDEAGIPFDQRNALVVGIAMGFAVIPTIFTITEDAIFSVPKSLSYGSLALGATPWQTMTRVVLPTASPGIFSALMVGMGRAVGETMIVLMATGNTPIMDINIFEGMRTLAANIAVEMPESEVSSTHYRILFLAAFSLFLFTFVVNTLAELIRQHLRKKYGSL